MTKHLVHILFQGTERTGEVFRGRPGADGRRADENVELQSGLSGDEWTEPRQGGAWLGEGGEPQVVTGPSEALSARDQACPFWPLEGN